jgi:hypothetical protein
MAEKKTPCSGGPMAAFAERLNGPLSQWPIQLNLLGIYIPFIHNQDLLVAADCTAFSTKQFHDRYLKDKKLMIGCPKLDNAQHYIEKLTEIFKANPVKSVTCLRMEVPCCGGMTYILSEAIKASGRQIPLKEIVIGINGEQLSENEVM